MVAAHSSPALYRNDSSGYSSGGHVNGEGDSGDQDQSQRPESASSALAITSRLANSRTSSNAAQGSTRPGLARAKTDLGPRRQDQNGDSGSETRSREEGEWKMRHGFDAQFTSEEYLNTLNAQFYMYYTDKRHETGGNPTNENRHQLQEWRMRDRLKTVSAVLALCLNIGVDPPDVIKTNPCARLECWIDPANSTGVSARTPTNEMGKALQQQYENLSMRTRYKLLADPTVEETKKYCTTLRKSAKDERILFHYNGHGVPKPTPSGEIWVFNKNYTQYIPISLYDLQLWLGAPSLFVWDCSEAGLILSNFNKFVEKHELEKEEKARDPNSGAAMNFADCIHLAACKDRELLPTNPDLPADVFTSCLTTPIEMAMRFFVLQNPLPSSLTVEDVQRIPGRVSERRTPMGELNWIFTAITDTIAWNSLSKPLFKKLFRQDLMVAALFRNFLLAQRIMRVYHCTPQSHPPIPQTHNHPLWHSWDLAVEMILAQLPQLIAAEKGEIQYEYQHSNFFSEQLTAFEVYLAQGAVEEKVPEQLPIVLQVLLSQVHRLRALILLSKFLDLGPWAVNLALSIGIFPYVLKLLQSQAAELKPVMIFIWARILAVDQSCQGDLLKDNGYQYFITMLDPSAQIPIGNAHEHKAMCAFIIATFCRNFHQGQVVSLSQEIFGYCLEHLKDTEHPLLRQWCCLCISMLWVNYPEAKWVGIRSQAWQHLCELALDPVAEVRAAMLHALTTFIGIPDLTDQVARIEESIASTVLIMNNDGSSLARRELLVFYSTFVERFKSNFIVAAFEQAREELESLRNPKNEELAKSSDLHLRRRPITPPEDDNEPAYRISGMSIHGTIWKQLLTMSADPHPEIARDASVIVDYVMESILEIGYGPLAAEYKSMLQEIAMLSARPVGLKPIQTEDGFSLNGHAPPVQAPPSPVKADGYISAGIRRTASVAASLKNLAFGSSSVHLAEPSSQANSVLSLPIRSAQHDRSSATRSRLPADWAKGMDDHDGYHHLGGRSLKTPLSRHFEPLDPKLRVIVPLKSKFFDWSAEYFCEPQMKPNEGDEPGSKDWNERFWRRERNERIIALTQPLKETAGTSKWDNPKGIMNNVTQPMKMCFHQFEDHLVVTDDTDVVCVWDWQKQQRLSRFSNGNPYNSKITEVRFINEDDQALLMTGSSDGVVKIFRNYEREKKIEIVSAFRALTDLVTSNKNAGLVFDWQQGRGTILVAGDVKVIRTWNAATEICTSDIPARSGSCVTSLTSDQVEGNLFVAGFGDGAVRVYDTRLKPATAMIKVWKEHRQWITNVHMQRGGMRELVSGCRSGTIKLWDIRYDNSLATYRATGSRDTLRSLSVHEHAPVYATGSERHTVKIFNMNGSELNHVEPYSSFLQNTRLSPISATAFHPHRMMLACAAMNDNHINLFACPEPKRPEAAAAAAAAGAAYTPNNAAEKGHQAL